MVTRHLEPLTEDYIRRSAHILGSASAAAKALADFEARKEAGEQVAFYQEGQAILVGPSCPAYQHDVDCGVGIGVGCTCNGDQYRNV